MDSRSRKSEDAWVAATLLSVLVLGSCFVLYWLTKSRLCGYAGYISYLVLLLSTIHDRQHMQPKPLRGNVRAIVSYAAAALGYWIIWSYAPVAAPYFTLTGWVAMFGWFLYDSDRYMDTDANFENSAIGFFIRVITWMVIIITGIGIPLMVATIAPDPRTLWTLCSVPLFVVMAVMVFFDESTL